MENGDVLVLKFALNYSPINKIKKWTNRLAIFSHL